MGYQEAAERAEKSGKLRSLTPKRIKLEKEGDRVVGKLLSIKLVPSTFGDGTYNLYVFETDEGPVVFSLSKATDSRYEGLLEIGRVYVIEHRGMQATRSGQEFKDVQVSLVTDPVEAGKEDEGVPF